MTGRVKPMTLLGVHGHAPIFFSPRRHLRRANLLWRYEVSDDGGKNWCSEEDWNDSGAYVLRRGNWVAPPVN